MNFQVTCVNPDELRLTLFVRAGDDTSACTMAQAQANRDHADLGPWTAKSSGRADGTTCTRDRILGCEVELKREQKTLEAAIQSGYADIISQSAYRIRVQEECLAELRERGSTL
jgi:hypothetical protein